MRGIGDGNLHIYIENIHTYYASHASGPARPAATSNSNNEHQCELQLTENLQSPLWYFEHL